MSLLDTIHYALLSQDVYNRGYQDGGGANGTWLPESGALGSAQIIWTSTNPQWEADGYYAIAYRVDSEIVLSFRGTNSELDQQTGWPLHEGLVSQQALYALESYNEVLALAGPGDEIVLTGHSMGGGLAGFVASIHGLEAHIFDHGSYANAASSVARIAALLPDWYEFDLDDRPHFQVLLDLAYGDGPRPPLDSSRIHAKHIEGEVLWLQRLLTFDFSSTEISVPNGIDWDDFPAVPPPEGLPGLFTTPASIALHNQSLLILRLALDDVTGNWMQVTPSLFPLFLHDKVAEAANIDLRGPDQSGELGSTMATMIAYSAVSGWSSPFGTVAMSHILDATQLFVDAEFEEEWFALQPLYSSVVLFSALLAKYEITDENVNSPVSWIEIDSYVNLDLGSETWSFGAQEYDLNAKTLFFEFLADDLSRKIQEHFADEDAREPLGAIKIYTGETSGVNISPSEEEYATLHIGTNLDDFYGASNFKDSFDGREGYNVADYSALTYAVTLNVSALDANQQRIINVSDGTEDPGGVLVGVSELIGTDYDDTLIVQGPLEPWYSRDQTSMEGRLHIDGGAGDDTFVIDIFNGSYPLTIEGGEGNDTFEITGGLIDSNGMSFDPGVLPLIVHGGEGITTYKLEGTMNVVFADLEDVENLKNIDFLELASHISGASPQEYYALVVIVNIGQNDIIEWEGQPITGADVTHSFGGLYGHDSPPAEFINITVPQYAQPLNVMVADHGHSEQMTGHNYESLDHWFQGIAIRGYEENHRGGFATAITAATSVATSRIRFFDLFNGDAGISFEDNLIQDHHWTWTSTNPLNWSSTLSEILEYFDYVGTGEFGQPMPWPPSGNWNTTIHSSWYEEDSIWYDDNLNDSTLRLNLDDFLSSSSAGDPASQFSNFVSPLVENTDYVEGTEVGEILDASGNTDVTIIGGGGDDILIGGSGTTTYLYNLDDGSDIIFHRNILEDDTSILVLQGILQSETQFVAVGQDLHIVVGLDTITIIGHFTSGGSHGLDEIIFSDEELSFGRAGIVNLLSNGGTGSVFGTDDSELLLGTDLDDVFYSSKGDDVLVGGAGSDTYHYSRGDGSKIIHDEDGGGGIDQLIIAGVNGTTETWLAALGEDLLIRIYDSSEGAGDGAVILIKGQLVESSDAGVEFIFDGYGNSWTRQDIIDFLAAEEPPAPELNEIIGTSGDDTLHGTSAADYIFGDDGDDSLWGHDGDDVLEGGGGDDWLMGGSGSDTFVFKPGSGWDGIGDFDVSSDIIEVHSLNGLTYSQIMVDAEEWGGNAWINLADDDTVVLYGVGLAQLSEANFRLLEVEPEAPQPNQIIGTAGDDVLYGTAGDDYIYGGDGDDQLFGGSGDDVIEGGAGDDWMMGGAGSDTFVFKPGSGEDGIGDFEVDLDVLELHGQSANTFAALMANAEEWGGNAWLYLDNDDLVVLYGVGLSELGADDFRFVA